MIQNAGKAEWTRLMSRGMFLGGAVLIVLGMLVTLLVYSQAGSADPNGPGAPLASYEVSNGFVKSLQFTGTLLGGASLVFFARTVTNEYQYGTLKVKLAREPRRLVLLAAKFLAMALFLTVALAVAYLCMLALGGIVAQTRGIDTSQWWTLEGIGENALGFLRLLVASLVWGLFGFTFGVLFRSGGAAIGIGLGSLLLGGHIGERFWADAGKWLPDALLAVFAVGGTPTVDLPYASLIVALYAVVLGAISAFGFTRGDVPG